MTDISKNPADHLLGKSLKDGWRVTQKRQSSHSGGAFSTGYFAEKNGMQCFVKALNYAPLFEMTNGENSVTRMLAQCFDAYDYEVSLLRNCNTARMKRVIRILDNGQIKMDGFAHPDVFYILLERADGDIREANPHTTWDNALNMRVLHRIAGGIRELHRVGISHRDIKPDNTLIGDQKNPASSIKIGDLGRAEISGKQHPLVKNEKGAGDSTYKPPEMLYRGYSPQKFDADFYQLGSMVLFLLMGLGTTPLLLNQLPNSQSPQQWQGTFEEILPRLEMAFSNILKNLDEKISQDMLTLRGKPATDLISVVAELCHPNPEHRGDKSRRKKFEAERYESIFDRLAKSFERRFSQ